MLNENKISIKQINIQGINYSDTKLFSHKTKKKKGKDIINLVLTRAGERTRTIEG